MVDVVDVVDVVEVVEVLDEVTGTPDDTVPSVVDPTPELDWLEHPERMRRPMHTAKMRVATRLSPEWFTALNPLFS